MFKYLKFLFLLLLSILLLYIVTHIEWVMIIQTDSVSTYKSFLGKHSLWNPPPIPISSQKYISEGMPVSVRPDFVPILVLFVLGFWSICTSIGLLYFLTQKGKANPMLHSIAYIGFYGAIGAACSLLLWVLLGGWGPPFFFLISGISLILGGFVGYGKGRDMQER